MKKVIFNIIGIFIILAYSSCDRILDVEPKQSIDSQIALTNNDAVEAALNSVYAYLRNVSQYGRDLIAIPELLADNAINTGASGRLVAQALNQPGAHLNNWQSSYYAINEINNLFAALDKLSSSQEFKNSIAGQLYFLRALYYHNLMREYAYDPTAIIEAANKGGVPIMVKPVLAVDDITYPARSPIETVYKYIYASLDSAEVKLQNTSNDRAPHYATAGAAEALFTRVALYNGDYSRVISEAEKALNSGVGTFQTKDDYIASWRMETLPESMFEIAFLPQDNVGVNNSLRATFTSRIFLTSSSFSNFGNVVVSDSLYQLYKNNDIRKQLIINGLGRNSNQHEITKFISRSGVANLDNVPVIRISEVYLNRAEAYARLGGPDNEFLARQDVNKIRERAGLSAVPASLSGQDLIHEILLQRRLELAFEGHRFFDMKRLGMDIHKESGTVRFDEYRILAPIPKRETDYNSNLEQNRGY